MPPARWVLYLRGTALTALGAFLLAGPLIAQGLGMDVPNKLPRWQMFAGIGIDSCQVAYTLVEPNGSRLEIRREDILGEPPVNLEGRKAREVGRGRLAKLHRSMCAALRDSGVEHLDLQARVRCGSTRRWVLEEDGKRNVCATKP
jgi:hypothetical protein